MANAMNGLCAVNHYNQLVGGLAKALSVPPVVAHWIAHKDPQMLFNPYRYYKFDRAPLSQGTNECPICLSAIVAGRRVILFEPCHHGIHICCAKQMIGSYMEQGRQLPFECHCGKGVMDSKHYFTSVIDALSKPINLPTCFVKCPNESCDMWLVAPFQQGRAKGVLCTCGRSFCMSCKEGAHGEISCMGIKELQDDIERIKVIDNTSVATVARYLIFKYPYATWNSIPSRSAVVERAFSSQSVPELTLDLVSNLTDPTFSPTTDSTENVLERFRAIRVFDERPIGIFDLVEHPFGESGKEDDTIRSKFCPQCFVRISRIDGCPSMVCTICKYHFCYNCLGPQHTHNRCDKAIDFATLKKNANREQREVVDGLSGKTVDDEIAEENDDARHVNLYYQSHDNNMHKFQRDQRHLPMAMRASRLQCLVDANASPAAIAVEANELAFLVHNEERMCQRYIDAEIVKGRARMEAVIEQMSGYTHDAAMRMLAEAKRVQVERTLTRLSVNTPEKRTILMSMINSECSFDLSLIDLDRISVAEICFRGAPFAYGDRVKGRMDNRWIAGAFREMFGLVTRVNTYEGTTHSICSRLIYPAGVDDIAVHIDGMTVEVEQILRRLRAAVEKDARNSMRRMMETFVSSAQASVARTAHRGDILSSGAHKDVVVAHVGDEHINVYIPSTGTTINVATPGKLQLPASSPWLTKDANRALHALSVVLGYEVDDSELYKAHRALAACWPSTEPFEWDCPTCTFRAAHHDTVCPCCESGKRPHKTPAVDVPKLNAAAAVFLRALRMV